MQFLPMKNTCLCKFCLNMLLDCGEYSVMIVLVVQLMLKVLFVCLFVIRYEEMTSKYTVEYIAGGTVLGTWKS